MLNKLIDTEQNSKTAYKLKKAVGLKNERDFICFAV